MACNDICIAFMHGTSRRVGCECMFGVDTAFGVRPWSTLCLVFDDGLSILDYIQWSLMGTFQLFLDKTIFQRLFNVFE